MKNKNILVIDGQGGGIGKQVIALLRSRAPELEITAVGTNAIATTAMLKAGASGGATGENAAIVGCRRADVIIGPVGVAIADSLYGEVTPKMAVAIGQSRALRVLIPVNHCENLIAGLEDISMVRLVENAVSLALDGLGGDAES